MSSPSAIARWPSAVATTVIWALAAASAVFWGLRLAAPPDGLPPAAATAPAAAPDPAAVAQALGALPAHVKIAAAPDAASRFALLGVVADTDRQGAALIAVDGKPPRPFRVGSSVADGYVLQSLGTRAANLGGSVDGPTALSLELPVRPLAVNGPPGMMGMPMATGMPPVTAPAFPLRPQSAPQPPQMPQPQLQQQQQQQPAPPQPEAQQQLQQQPPPQQPPS
jgi:general secretion pathway protein C